MNRFRTDKEQQALLQQFFDQRKLWNQEIGIINFVTCILLGISALFIFVPYQVWDRSVLMGVYMMYIMGVLSYMNQFSIYKDSDKNRKISDILSRLPVSKAQLKIYKMKKAARLCRVFTAASIVSQCVFAVTVMNTFSVLNILMPLVMLLAVPVFLTV